MAASLTIKNQPFSCFYPIKSKNGRCRFAQIKSDSYVYNWWSLM